MQKILFLTHKEFNPIVIDNLLKNPDVDVYSTNWLYDNRDKFADLSMPHRNKTVKAIYVDIITENFQLTRDWLLPNMKYLIYIDGNIKSEYRLMGLAETFVRTYPNNVLLWEQYNHEQLEEYLGFIIDKMELPIGGTVSSYEYYLGQLKSFRNYIRREPEVIS